ncbi:coiled-coil domain-containing protein 86 [Bombina bombina]|uniref:coiled-coil domain-containing protein 86 n=1 Tax=Bombina bombina TaxID=8345 RepID=UPI00235AE25F|nr:coiled-coil domain-containing protein 86 [Bombina bombina]
MECKKIQLPTNNTPLRRSKRRAGNSLLDSIRTEESEQSEIEDNTEAQVLEQHEKQECATESLDSVISDPKDVNDVNERLDQGEQSNDRDGPAENDKPDEQSSVELGNGQSVAKLKQDSKEGNIILKKDSTSGSCLIKPRGKPKSGRIWKDTNKKRFSQMVNGHSLSTSWEVKMKARQEKKVLKEFSKQLKDEKQREKDEKKKRREENLKRRLENERKAEVVQVIRNPAKLKRAKKKQLRRIEKRDTLKLSQSSKKVPQSKSHDHSAKKGPTISS